jgi:hypothetical protein
MGVYILGALAIMGVWLLHEYLWRDGNVLLGMHMLGE